MKLQNVGMVTLWRCNIWDYHLQEIGQIKNKSLYSTDTLVPQYTPNSVKPKLKELVDVQKYQKLVYHINKSDISEEEKDFLKIAATRHFVFNYAKIADYYVSTTPEMQRLMEESALVMLDIDDAIAYGYVQLSKNIKKYLIISEVI